MQKSLTCVGLVIRNINIGETDLITTLITKEYGKIAVLAKGARRLVSTKRATLEPGNLVKIFLITRQNGMPLLTEAKLIQQDTGAHKNLQDYRKLSQFLEIINALFVEQEIDKGVWQKIVDTRRLLDSPSGTNIQVQHNLRLLIISLGFEDPQHSNYPTITKYVSALADRKLNSYDYLKVS